MSEKQNIEVVNASEKENGLNPMNTKDEAKKSFKEKRTNNRESLSPTGFEERIVAIKRISKTTKGGRMMRFSALVVIGNKKGIIGFGMGKSNEVPDAIKKAIKNANNSLINVKINKRGTMFHEVHGKHGASVVMLKPATTGKGIIAGGPVRAVVELAGFQDIYTKSLGSNTAINMIRATVDGLKKQFTPLEIAKLRDKELKDL